MLKLRGGGVFLRYPEARDYLDWSQLRAQSRAFLTPWEPTWAEDELSRARFKTRLKRYAEDVRDGRGHAFFTFRESDGALVGGLTFSRLQLGVTQSVTMGYWAGAAFARQGYTRAAARLAVRFAFEDLGLHRVEASCQPDNEPSRRLLTSIGFTQEGMARAYLKIDGAWRDHLLFAMVSGDRLT
jgi:ribosomal-protein-alanine N-acetyltransferase